MRWYEVTVEDTGSGQKHTWREEVGGRRGMILPPARKAISWDVPEELDILRRQLAERPELVTVRVRVAYNFQAVAVGVIRTGVAGIVEQKIKEVVRPIGEDQDLDELLVSRGVVNKLIAATVQNAIYYVENSGLDAAEWNSARESLDRVVATALERLTVANLGDLMDLTNQKFIYRVTDGQVEAKPILSKNKVLQRDHEEEYHRKAKEAVKAISDVAHNNQDARKFHSELQRKLKLDASLGIDVVGIFGGDAEFHLEKDDKDLTESDVKQIAKSREYFLSDRNWEEEISHKVQDKIKGELIEEKISSKDAEDRAAGPSRAGQSNRLDR